MLSAVPEPLLLPCLFLRACPVHLELCIAGERWKLLARVWDDTRAKVARLQRPKPAVVLVQRPTARQWAASNTTLTSPTSWRSRYAVKCYPAEVSCEGCTTVLIGVSTPGEDGRASQLCGAQPLPSNMRCGKVLVHAS